MGHFWADDVICDDKNVIKVICDVKSVIFDDVESVIYDVINIRRLFEALKYLLTQIVMIEILIIYCSPQFFLLI